MRKKFIYRIFWSSDIGNVVKNSISSLFKVRILSKSQNARTMILTKNVNGSKLRLTITMNETHANHEWLQIETHRNHERCNIVTYGDCGVCIHGYGETQSGTIHGLRESHSWL